MSTYTVRILLSSYPGLREKGKFLPSNLKGCTGTTLHYFLPGGKMSRAKPENLSSSANNKGRLKVACVVYVVVVPADRMARHEQKGGALAVFLLVE